MNSKDPFHPDNLRIDVSKLPKPEPAKRLVWDARTETLVPASARSMSRGDFEYVLFPAEPFARLVAKSRSPEFALLLIILRRWYGRFKRNPIPLARIEVRDFQVSRWQKYRALKRLAEAGLISVKQERGKPPLVTLLWKPLKP